VIWVNLASSVVWNAEGNPKYAVGIIEDISGRKRAEAERQQVEAERRRLLEREQVARLEAETERHRLHEILMQLPAMIAIVTGPDFVFEFANPTYLEVIGRSREIVGQSARDVFPETKKQIYFDILSQIYQTGKPFIQNEFAFDWDRDGDGQVETGFFNCVFLALQDAAGVIQGVLLHATEVTAQVLARRQVEALVQDLRREEERQSFLIRLNDVIRSLHDPKAIMWEASCAVGQYLQVSRTTYGEIDSMQNYVIVEQDYCQDVISAVGHHQLESFGPEIIAELKQGKTLVIDDVQQDSRTAIAGVEAFQAIETRAVLCVPLVKAERFVALFVLHHKNPRVWTSDEVALMEQVAEQTWLAVERARAEQALRESEERLQLALKVGCMGMWDWVIPTNAVTWSEGHFLMLGLHPDECQASYDIWLKSVHPEDLAATEIALQRAMQERVEYWHEYRTVRPDGLIRWVEARAKFDYDAEGQPKRMTGMLVDISDRKQAEQEREQLLERERTARQTAEAANRIKDEFLAVLSHELRSPLNPILGWAKLLRTRKFDQAATDKALETIERNAKLQAQLVEDLLDVSRILQGKLLLNVSPINLATTILAALETVRLAAQAKEIQIHTDIDSMTGLVSGDANRLQQVIWNLLSNAVKFTPCGGAVEVRLERSDNMAHVQVKDTGKGIDPIFLPHVFEYFRQEDGTTTRQFGGLGLGLAIARHLVELHGGTVQAESLGEGRGATFTVKLPLMHELVEAIQIHAVAANLAELVGLKALVVDDEADMRELVAVILSQAGAEVSVATSAATALSILDQFQPDVLICDIGMPAVDGYVLLRHIRQRHLDQGGQIPAIALTAYASEVDRQEAIAAGFQLHLAKPIDPAELIAAVTSLVEVAPSPV
ncbi:MAG TPA: ATP-binding protein, partial [Allocoleopsis sp.]